MATPQAVHHSLLRPCILHILRAAGYHSTRPSVLDTLTDIAARYMLLLATSTVKHATLNHDEFEPDISVEDIRMAMQDCGIVAPEQCWEDQCYDDEEDARGVDAFIAWVTGAENKEIRRIALEGTDDSKEDYLTGLLKRYDRTEDASRYKGTIFGEETETGSVIVEGSDISSLKEWEAQIRKQSVRKYSSSEVSRKQSSDLSSLDGQSMAGVEFD